MIHISNNCPMYLAENGQWSSTMNPYCICDTTGAQPMANMTSSWQTNATTCTHWWRFLDYLGVGKNEKTFYCQKCLEIKTLK